MSDVIDDAARRRTVEHKIRLQTGFWVRRAPGVQRFRNRLFGMPTPPATAVADTQAAAASKAVESRGKKRPGAEATAAGTASGSAGSAGAAGTAANACVNQEPQGQAEASTKRMVKVELDTDDEEVEELPQEQKTAVAEPRTEEIAGTTA